MGELVRGTDDGGVRWFLDGRPINCGRSLRLRMPDNQWSWVTFETSYVGRDGHVPALHFSTGHRWEWKQRFQLRKSEGQPYRLFDRKHGHMVTCTARGEPTADFPEGRLLYGSNLERDTWPLQEEAEREAQFLASGGGADARIVLTNAQGQVDVRGYELRWPDAIPKPRGDLDGRVYLGEFAGPAGDRQRVLVAERSRPRWDLQPRTDLRNHSPTGFAWGYTGSGPAQLALALAADVLAEDDLALDVYQLLKERVVAQLDQRYPFVLVAREVYDTCLGLLDEVRP